MFKSNREIPDELNRISTGEKKGNSTEERKMNDGNIDVSAEYEVHTINLLKYRLRFIDD